MCPPADPMIPGLSSGADTMFYAGSIGTQIANEFADSYRYESKLRHVPLEVWGGLRTHVTGVQFLLRSGGRRSVDVTLTYPRRSLATVVEHMNKTRSYWS